MTAVSIPPTVNEAVTALDGIGQLLTAKHWERAAIVYAFTHGAVNQHDVVHDKSCSVREFARLGVTGLRSQDSVRKYRRAWADAVQRGDAQPSTPGDTVDLPDTEWCTERSKPDTSMTLAEARACTASIRSNFDGLNAMIEELAAIDPDEAKRMKAWANGYLEGKFASSAE